MNLNELEKVLIATFGEKYQGKAPTPTNLVVGIGEKISWLKIIKPKQQSKY